MGVKMTGIWTRKPDMEFADIQAMQRAYSLICRHPYTIASTPEFADEYAAIFGADELQVLKDSLRGTQYSMVMSPNEEWVKGTKTYVPPAPKPERVLLPGNKWIDTSYGKVQVPKGQVTDGVPAAVSELSDEVKRELSSIVYEAVTAALKVWSQQ